MYPDTRTVPLSGKGHIMQSADLVKVTTLISKSTVASSSMAEVSFRRKVPSLEEKLKILKLINSGTFYSTITSQYGIRKSTVW